MPDDSPILANISLTVPHLQSVSSRCKMILPSSIPHVFDTTDLSLVHINARSLHQSFDSITSLVTRENVKVDILMLSETWVNPDVIDCYQIDGYEMLHSIPYGNVTGKGCAMYIKKEIFPYCTIVKELSICQVEFQCISVLIASPEGVSFIVSTLYRSPSYPLSLLLPFLDDSLDRIARLKKPCFWAGDFNVNLFKYNDSHDPKAFLDCMNSYGFFPTITVPTRISNVPPFSATLIDNIFTNALDSITFNGALCAGIADHQAVCCTTDLVQRRRPAILSVPPKPRFGYSRLEELKTNLSSSLDGLLAVDDPEICARSLITAIQTEVSDLSIDRPNRRNNPIQPWITQSLLGSINARNTLLRTFLRNRSAENLSKYKKYRNVLRLTMRRAKQEYFRSQFSKKCSQSQKAVGRFITRH